MEASGMIEQEHTLKWHQNTSVGEVERHEDSVSETGSPTTHHLTGSRTFSIKILGYKLEFILFSILQLPIIHSVCPSNFA